MFVANGATVTTATLQDGTASLDSYLSRSFDWTGLNITDFTLCLRFKLFQMRGTLLGSLLSMAVRENNDSNFFVISEIIFNTQKK